jgi:hypothetical protein
MELALERVRGRFRGFVLFVLKGCESVLLRGFGVDGGRTVALCISQNRQFLHHNRLFAT